MTEIIVAEDDVDDYLLFEEVATQHFPKVELRRFENGELLMKYLKSKKRAPPPLVVLDLNMPIKDGRQVLKEIRESRAFDSTKVAVLTTTDSPSDREYVESFKHSCFATKPPSYTQYVNVVKKILAKHVPADAHD